MDHHFWLSRWEQNDIGFHKNQVHHYLINYFDRLNLTPGDTIFVPLCGKSLDMLWLRKHGIHVVGSELSQTAAENFFTENNIDATLEVSPRFRSYRCDGLELLCGDHFELQRSDLHGVIAAYDRAALVALPPGHRRRYSDHMTRLLPANSRIMLISYEYDQSEIKGPPSRFP